MSDKKTVRAKFRVDSITRQLGTRWEECKSVAFETQTIRLYPVSSGSEENKAFYANMPSGTIDLTTINADAASVFELNGEYYVDFTPAKS